MKGAPMSLPPRLLTLAVILVPLGACIGYLTGHADYTSAGQLRFFPASPGVYVPNPPGRPVFAEFVEGEAAKLHSQRVLDVALADNQWKELPWPPAATFSGTLGEELKVTVDGNVINVSLTDRNPKAAQLAVTTILNAYGQLFQEMYAGEFRLRNDLLSQQLISLQSDSAAIRQQIHSLVLNNSYGTDNLTQAYDSKLKELQACRQALLTADLLPRKNATATTRPTDQLAALQSAADKSAGELQSIGMERFTFEESSTN